MVHDFVAFPVVDGVVECAGMYRLNKYHSSDVSSHLYDVSLELNDCR